MMRCSLNGAYVNDEPAGAGFPATYWACDLFKCDGCGATIATGFSHEGALIEEAEEVWGHSVKADSHSFRYPGETGA
jgi:hypothetical protein